MNRIKEIAECAAAVVVLFATMTYYFTLYCFDKLWASRYQPLAVMLLCLLCFCGLYFYLMR